MNRNKKLRTQINKQNNTQTKHTTNRTPKNSLCIIRGHRNDQENTLKTRTKSQGNDLDDRPQTSVDIRKHGARCQTGMIKVTPTAVGTRLKTGREREVPQHSGIRETGCLRRQVYTTHTHTLANRMGDGNM